MYTNNNLSMFSPFSSGVDRLFDSWVSPVSGLRSVNSISPPCDIEESEDLYLISMEMAGFKKDDIKIEVNGSQLTISAERKREKDAEKAGWYSERQFGKVQRSFTIPEGIDVDKVEADYEDGVLRLMVPKAESAKTRQIKIGNAGGVSKFFGKLLSGSSERSGQEREREEASGYGNNKSHRNMTETDRNRKAAA